MHCGWLDSLFLSSVPVAETSHGAHVTDLLRASEFSYLKHTQTGCAVTYCASSFTKPAGLSDFFSLSTPYVLRYVALPQFAFLSYRSPRSQACHCLEAHYKAVITFRCGNRSIQSVMLHPTVSGLFFCLTIISVCVCLFAS